MSSRKLCPVKLADKHILSLEWNDRSLFSLSKEKLEEFEWRRKTSKTIKRHYDEFRQGITQERAHNDILSLETDLWNNLSLKMGMEDKNQS